MMILKNKPCGSAARLGRDYSQNAPKSKRPRIGQNVPKNWSKRPHGIKCWSKRPQNCFLLYILCNFRHDLGCSNETVLDKVFYHDSILLFQ